MAGPNMQNHDYVMPDAEKTLVLFGKVGNGKSAVGNSILGRKEFVSVLSASGVTTTCKLGKSRLNDDEVVNVIDTPGIFNSSSGTENFVDEFFKCNTLAKDGIDGFILVCSIRSRFSIEEEGVLHFLKKIFGEKVMNYLILVFTGGDELETPIREYLDNCPSSFQTVLQLCGKRVVLFDNKTRDEYKRKTQVQQLMSLVKMVKFENGQSYKSDVILEIIEKKREARGHDIQTPMTRWPQTQRGQVGQGNVPQISMSYTAQTKPYDRGSGSKTCSCDDYRKEAQLYKTEAQQLQKKLEKVENELEKREQEIQRLKRQYAPDRRGFAMFGSFKG